MRPFHLLIRFAIVLAAALIPLASALLSPPSSASTDTRAAAQRVANQVDGLLQVRMVEIFTIAAFPSIRAFAATDPSARAQRAAVALNELQAWVAADDNLREAFIVDGQAKVVLTTGEVWNQDWSARSFIKNALAGQLDTSAPSRDVNETSQYYAAPILNNSRNVVGALVVRIDAQELSKAVGLGGDSAGAENYAVLVDENGVRLADGGDPARNLVALAPLVAEQQTRAANEHTYGSQLALVRATNLNHAAQMIESNSAGAIRPDDLGVAAVSAQRLTTKPWTVLFVTARPVLVQSLPQIILPVGAAIALALLAALVLSRYPRI